MPEVRIADLVPHQGAMCLLDGIEAWSASHVHAVSRTHRAVDHPLRVAGGLPAMALVEYAAQAMALHGALQGQGRANRPGMLAAVRDVRLAVDRIDDLADPLDVRVTREFADARMLSYAFEVAAGGRVLATGRATVVLAPPNAEGAS